MLNIEEKRYRLESKTAFCVNAHICKYGKNCSGKKCFDCEFDNDINACIKAMLDEYKDPIKLKQWEKDLLDCTFNKSLDFKDYRDLLEMKHRGYFKGISDTDMKLGEILENCEVVE